MSRVIKLRALKKIGKKHGMIVLAVQIDDNTYRTGQHYDIKNPSNPYLTLKEMTSEIALSEEKAKVFPYVINPLNPLKFKDGDEFDIETPRGKAIVDFIRLNAFPGTVAENKESINRSKSEWYFEDKEQEADTSLKMFDVKFKAGGVLNAMSVHEKLRLANYLFIFKGDKELSKNNKEAVLFARLYQYCEFAPQVIIDSQLEENKTNLLIAEMVEKGIIKKSGSDYYDGTNLVAKDFASLVYVYKTELHLQQQWDVRYRQIMNNPSTMFNPVIVEQISVSTQEFLESIIKRDRKSLEILVKNLERSNDMKSKQLLAEYRSQINDILNPVDKTMKEETPMVEEPKKQEPSPEKISEKTEPSNTQGPSSPGNAEPPKKPTGRGGNAGNSKKIQKNKAN